MNEPAFPLPRQNLVPPGHAAPAWWRHDCHLNIRELPPEALVCDHCGARKPVTA